MEEAIRIHQPSEKWEMLVSILDMSSRLPQTFLSPYRYGTARARHGVLSVPGDATFRRGQNLFKLSLSGRCLSGAFRRACARGEVEDTVHITTMPLGGKRNFSERSASVLIDTVGEARI